MPAAPAVVFECWSDADSMAQWMCPSEGMTKASVRIDFRYNRNSAHDHLLGNG